MDLVLGDVSFGKVKKIVGFIKGNFGGNILLNVLEDVKRKLEE